MSFLVNPAVEPRRYLGLELSGAKNRKTALAALEYYPKEKKIFLLDIYERVSGHEEQTGDEALLDLLQEIRSGVVKMGVNVPLTLPPCMTCTLDTCPLPSQCQVPSVKFMRDLTRKNEIRMKEFTPYTQRPIELWVKNRVFPKLLEEALFDIDETLGGNRAPLTARMQFLKRHLGDLPMIEVWPKLSLAVLAPRLGLNKRQIAKYRNLEEGAHFRIEIIERLAGKFDSFIYERDIHKLAHSLAAFDAFLCAFTALLSDLGQCAKIPKGFTGEKNSTQGWVEYPKL